MSAAEGSGMTIPVDLADMRIYVEATPEVLRMAAAVVMSSRSGPQARRDAVRLLSSEAVVRYRRQEGPSSIARFLGVSRGMVCYWLELSGDNPRRVRPTTAEPQPQPAPQPEPKPRPVALPRPGRNPGRGSRVEDYRLIRRTRRAAIDWDAWQERPVLRPTITPIARAMAAELKARRAPVRAAKHGDDRRGHAARLRAEMLAERREGSR